MSQFHIESNYRIPTSQTVKKMIGFITRRNDIYENLFKNHKYVLNKTIDGNYTITHKMENGKNLGRGILTTNIKEYIFASEKEVPEIPFLS